MNIHASNASPTAILALSLLALGTTANVTSAQATTTRTRNEITTYLECRSEFNREPFGYRVEWIRWDSPFRGTGLRLGDRIIGIDGKRLAPSLRHKHTNGIGTYSHSESAMWTKRGLRDGSPVSLLVWRDGQELRIQGQVRTEREYFRDRHPLMARGGPKRREKDGFHPCWDRWYRDMKKMMGIALTDGLFVGGYDNRSYFKQLDDQRKRMVYLVKNYPGPFTTTLVADWKAARARALGAKIGLSEQDLAYRELGAKRADTVSKAAATARQAFLDAHEKNSLKPFPTIDPVRGDRSEVTGKIVALPQVRKQRALFKDGASFYLAVGDRARGVYFIDYASRPMAILHQAMVRYRRDVSPQLRDQFEFIGRIEEEPRMLIWHGAATTGFSIVLLAARVDGKLFVDLTGNDPDVQFAGEKDLKKVTPVTLSDNAGPEQVMATFIGYIKVANRAKWEKLFVDWEVRTVRGGTALETDRPRYSGNLNSAWRRSRQLILDDIYDVRVVAVGKPRTIHGGKSATDEEAELLGLEDEASATKSDRPTVEECDVRVVHIGKFKGAYRPYIKTFLRRHWKLQRINGGPWRIASVQSL